MPREQDGTRRQMPSVMHTPFPVDVIPVEALDEQSSHIVEILRWQDAFKPLLSTKHPTTRGRAALLQVNALAAQIVLESAFMKEECLLDKLLPVFQEIVMYAKRFNSYFTSRLSAFSADVCVGPPLYLTARMCRHGPVRREAIALLRNTRRREGTWDSLVVAEIATWLMEIEEEGMEGDFIPETSRVRVAKANLDEPKEDLLLTCMKRVRRPDGTMDYVKATVNWDQVVQRKKDVFLS
ncbi:hypothetical protein BP6252_08879 [Coleophoma cylindrospora]|uniref:Uncharacterized protein n=1 Tax=Coleophoma cylindrospora TaxID=1849047 RepID=A0A3D8R733_9HELO|nr:hypothetical protein BP6252_08879 [Coleophoma cylindrospora]